MKFQADEELSLIKLMTIKVGGSVKSIKSKIKLQDIYIDGELNDAHNPTIPKGAVIELRDARSQTGEGISILYEDADIIAVEKPVGILSTKSLNDQDHTAFGKVNKYLKRKYHNKQRAYVVHRLDQKVSGVILFAKSMEVVNALSKNWPSFEKIYHALVEGCPNPEFGKVESWLSEDKVYKVHSGEERPDSHLAITHYKVEKKFRKYSLLSVRLGTGKKHQIRVQLASLGCPIVGDTKYGASAGPIGRIGLHAHTFKFTHPKSGKKIEINAPSPASFHSF